MKLNPLSEAWVPPIKRTLACLPMLLRGSKGLARFTGVSSVIG
jgi:hypothetical protein